MKMNSSEPVSVHSTLGALGEPFIELFFFSTFNVGINVFGNKDALVCKCSGLCEREIGTEIRLYIANLL